MVTSISDGIFFLRFWNIQYLNNNIIFVCFRSSMPLELQSWLRIWITPDDQMCRWQLRAPQTWTIQVHGERCSYCVKKRRSRSFRSRRKMQPNDGKQTTGQRRRTFCESGNQLISDRNFWWPKRWLALSYPQRRSRWPLSKSLEENQKSWRWCSHSAHQLCL